MQNQSAIISGGLGDIGRAIAIEFAKRGVNIALGDIRPPADAEDFLKQLRAKNVRARYDRVDVADAQQVEHWVSAAQAELGIASIIIPNAAIVTMASVRDVTPPQWKHELSINLDGAFHLASFASKKLLDAKKTGHI